MSSDLLPESWRVMGLCVVSSDPMEHTDVLCPEPRSGIMSEETGDSSSLLSLCRQGGRLVEESGSSQVFIPRELQMWL